MPFYNAQHPRYQVPSEEEPRFGVSDRRNHLSLSRSVMIVRLEERCPPGPRQAEKQLLHNEEQPSWIRQQGTVHILEIYRNHQFESGQVDIGYVTVEHRTRGFDHTIRKLGAHAHRVSTGNFQRSKNGCREVAYAMPLMRLIFPFSTKLRVLTCLTMGQRNRTSPPPSGGEPRFLIFAQTRKHELVHG